MVYRALPLSLWDEEFTLVAFILQNRFDNAGEQPLSKSPQVENSKRFSRPSLLLGVISVR